MRAPCNPLKSPYLPPQTELIATNSSCRTKVVSELVNDMAAGTSNHVDVRRLVICQKALKLSDWSSRRPP